MYSASLLALRNSLSIVRPTALRLALCTLATATTTRPLLERSQPPKTLTTYKKPFTKRKQYLFAEYETQMALGPIVVIQFNNLSGAEQLDFRRSLKLSASNAHMMVVRPKMFKAVVRHTKYINMSNLFSGPSAIIYWDQEEDVVAGMRKVIELVGKQKKIILMGAKYNDLLLNPEMMKGFVNLPNVDQLRAQVVGVLESPAQRLASAIKRVPQRLVGVLKQKADGEAQSE
ncbi:hypothetical protein GGI25_004884 [Coemansia spiralis]|uniref:Ribosomal protein L10 n=2 Tax=Coemansia TaxID=4863 RepID=A0A9W8KV57_9FUNG|nr:hypothetical protein EDC05_003819 [Coemansia umbellata]KAJ2622625.1 hypothetical protein GGI26_003071 [Coemansia sp. RSA 1358]KAJ2672903.1 hypothetical protein GGI25_004884 [Coemansia spiralis]